MARESRSAIALVEAPTSAGAYSPGAGGGPAVAGLADRHERLGLVYFDRHADLNVPGSTVDGALDWMGVAHMLDVEGAVDGLAGLGARRPMLGADGLRYLGLKEQTAREQSVIDARAIPVVDVGAVADDPVSAARAALAPLAGCGSSTGSRSRWRRASAISSR